MVNFFERGGRLANLINSLNINNNNEVMFKNNVTRYAIEAKIKKIE